MGQWPLPMDEWMTAEEEEVDREDEIQALFAGRCDNCGSREHTIGECS